MPYVVATGTSDPNNNWTTSVILERDDDGNVTKEVTVGVPVDLSKSEQDDLSEKFGLVFEDSSATEAKEAAAEAAANPPVVGGVAPVFGNTNDDDDDDDK
jgi:hypothetical protein